MIRLLLWCLIGALTGCGVWAKEPANLGLLKIEVLQYYDNGDYHRDLQEVVNRALNYLERRAVIVSEADRKKWAIVFDVDETLLFNYDRLKQAELGGTKEKIIGRLFGGEDTVVKACKQLYDYARQHGFSIFIIASRPTSMKEMTIQNLNAVGISRWDGIYFKPSSFVLDSVSPYKTAIRRQIEGKGHKIIVNIGDQYSDLDGDFSEWGFKLPNPFYYIP